MCVQRSPRSACASAQSDQDHRCPQSESLEILECFNVAQKDARIMCRIMWIHSHILRLLDAAKLYKEHLMINAIIFDLKIYSICINNRRTWHTCTTYNTFKYCTVTRTIYTNWIQKKVIVTLGLIKSVSQTHKLVNISFSFPWHNSVWYR